MYDLRKLKNLPSLQENTVFNLKSHRLNVDDALYLME